MQTVGSTFRSQLRLANDAAFSETHFVVIDFEGTTPKEPLPDRLRSRPWAGSTRQAAVRYKAASRSTRLLAKHVVPDLRAYGLDALPAHYGIPQPPHRHRAMEDVIVTASLFRTLLTEAARTHSPSAWPTSSVSLAGAHGPVSRLSLNSPDRRPRYRGVSPDARA